MAERKKAVELYSKSDSLQEVATKLGRSVGGVYKILKEESCPIRKRKKVDQQLRVEILQLYFKEGLPTPGIAKITGLAKSTVLYWLKRSDSPITDSIRKTAGSGKVRISSGKVDLLPFVETSHLRWADENRIVLRVGNSRLAVTSRTSDAWSFFRLAGFYLAEGNKTSWSADLSNTNLKLIDFYRGLARSIVKSEVGIRSRPQSEVRATLDVIKIGGICMKKLLLKAIDGILGVLGGHSRMSKQMRRLGLSFLNGYSDGDGTVSKSKQKKSSKQYMQLRLTEGRFVYAVKLLKVLRCVLSVGFMQKPRRRNYYEVKASLNPQRAALLLSAGFFSEHHENRKRLAAKALDSSYISRYLQLYALFHGGSFSRTELLTRAPNITAHFVGRSVVGGQLVPVGVVKTAKGAPIHWHRSYVLSDETQILVRRILESMGGLEVQSRK